MRIPNCVIDELAGAVDLGSIERLAYLAAWAYEPRSIVELSRAMRVDRAVASRACRSLVTAGWMIMVPANRGKCPAALIPNRCQETMAKDLMSEYSMIPEKRGEFLFNKRMDWSLRGDDYILNARPAFLKNPITGASMEYDRYDPKNKFASELNGTQHYQASEGYSEQDVREQQARDLMKESLSAKNGVTLLVLKFEDLLPGVLEMKLDKVVPHLKRAYVQMDGPYAQALNQLCAACAKKALRG